MNDDDVKYLQVRLGDDLHARLKAAADAEHRSINGEVLVAIEQYLRKRDRDDREQAAPAS
jgi:hypothetical protein